MMKNDEKDHSAGLIHAADTGHGDTLPRLICDQRHRDGFRLLRCTLAYGHDGDHRHGSLYGIHEWAPKQSEAQ